MSTEKERELFEERLRKLESLKKGGVDPYPAETRRTHTVAEALEKFGALSKSKKSITLAGRIRGLRAHGALIFGTLEDFSGRLQFLLKKDEIPEKDFAQFAKFFDIGDFVELSGGLMETKRGEKTLLVSSYRMLAKSLRALPDQWHGLTNVEARLRKRYLDLLMSAETRELFVKKAKFWATIREHLLAAGFLEVETPVLERVPGGAEAEPFVTHYNALDQDFYLRISLELPLKRLLVGGYERIFEIGRVFRNEGISSEHLQDYTAMEFYWAYADFEDLKEFLQKLYREIVKELFGTTKVTVGGKEVDWGAKWKEYDYYAEFKKHAKLDLEKASETDLVNLCKKLGVKIEKSFQRGRLVDLIYKKTVRPNLTDVGFLVYPPVEIEPLAKRVADDPKRVQRLQVIAWGTELGKGFAELNDPIDQRERFAEQMKLRAAGDKEAQMLDEDFVEALEYGMPPAAGFGLSERLFAILMDKSIRETVIFPSMRSEKHEEK